MNKILVIGQENAQLRAVAGELEKEFSVMLCGELLDGIREAERTFVPDLLLYQRGEDTAAASDFLSWVGAYREDVPVLVLSTEALWTDIAGYCRTAQFTRMLYPLNIPKLISTCREILYYAPRRAVPEAEEVKEEKLTVMLVDDSPLFLRSVKKMLEDRFAVLLANSGEKALSMLSRKTPALVLLDYEMGGMSGKETFDEMLKDPRMKNIPVIFLTGISQKETVYSVLSSKPAGYVLKPVEKDFLLA